MPMDFIQANILTIAIAILSFIMLLWPGFRQSGKSVTTAQATQLINREDALIIDVRESHEYAAGHMPDARNIPLKDLAAKADELAGYKEKPLILVCASGVRSGQGCSQLEKLGFTKLNNLDGGVAAWEKAGLPIKRGSKKK